MSRYKFRHQFRPQRNRHPARFSRKDHSRQRRARMMQDSLAAGCFHAVRHHAERPQRMFNVGRQDQMVDPFEKIGPSLLAHALSQAPREAIALQEGTHQLAQKFLRVKRHRPIEPIIHKNNLPANP